MRQKNKQSGFTLVELMVVVAITGVLAVLSVMSFRSFKFKASQAEAKSELSSLHAAQQSFRSEWQTYYGNFNIIGYQPRGELRYITGFGGSCDDNANGCWGEGASASAISDTKIIATPGGTSLDRYYGVDVTSTGDPDLAYDINTSGDTSRGGVCVGTNARCNYVGVNFGITHTNVSAGGAPVVAGFTACGDNTAIDETAVKQNCFVAYSISDLMGCGTTQGTNCKWDVWMINEGKEIVHKQSAAE